MNKDNYKWLDSVPNLSDKRIVLYIKGITRRIEIVEDKDVLTNLNERLGVLEVEAEKRGLIVENA